MHSGSINPNSIKLNASKSLSIFQFETFELLKSILECITKVSLRRAEKENVSKTQQVLHDSSLLLQKI